MDTRSVYTRAFAVGPGGKLRTAPHRTVPSAWHGRHGMEAFCSMAYIPYAVVLGRNACKLQVALWLGITIREPPFNESVNLHGWIHSISTVPQHRHESQSPRSSARTAPNWGPRGVPLVLMRRF